MTLVNELAGNFFFPAGTQISLRDTAGLYLTNNRTGVTGWGIAYLPQIENLTGLTENYEVQFFTRHTQTFYEPFLETNYNDIIEDDRNSFSLGKVNKLYLYLYEDGNPINLDSLPSVSISDANGTPIPNLTTSTTIDICQRTKGVYEITIPPLSGYKTPCTFYDVWSDLFINGFEIPDITNSFTVYPLKKSIQIGTTTQDPKVYGFDFARATVSIQHKIITFFKP